MRSLGIRSVLFVVLSVLTAIPVLWLGNKQANHFAKEVRQSYDDSLNTAVSGIANQLRLLLDTRVRDMESLASAVEVVGLDDVPGLRKLLAAHWKSSRYYQGMYIADAKADVLARARGELEASGNYSDRDYYKLLLERGTTTISRAQMGKVLGVPSIQIASPVRSETPALSEPHELLGFVEGSAGLDSVSVLVQRYVEDLPKGRIVVVDPFDRVVADSSNTTVPLSDVSANRLFEHSIELKPQDVVSPGGDRFRRAQAAGEGSVDGFRVLAFVPHSVIAAVAMEQRSQVWIASALAWLLALVLSGGIAHWLGVRFGGLAETVKAVGQGDFTRRGTPQKPWEPVEIGVLVTQIDEMACRLQRHTSDLEQRVRERTRELALVNARLEVLVNALERAEDGIEITDRDGRYLYVNPALEKITGYTPKELINNYPSILRSGDYDDAFYNKIQEQLQAGRVFSGAFTGKRKDGTLFDQELTVWPVLGDDGGVTHVVGLRRDVTERRKTEQALRVSERMASVGTLAAGVAHEINNPLTYVLLSLRSIERELQRYSGELPEQLSHKAGAAIEHALEGAERVHAIVKDLRTFSRVDDETFEAIEPQEVLESALRMVSNDIRHKAKLVRDYQATARVMGNHARLSQVFLNLLVNAAHSLDEGDANRDEIRVLTRTGPEGQVIVEVQDTGTGIPEEHLGRIFDPFFTTKPVGVGTGLGLSMCHNIVTGMGGKISVRSTVGKGSSFIITLPAARMGARTEGQDAITASRRVLKAEPSRVLVVDDEVAVANSIAEALEHHHVVQVDSGAKALEELQRRKYDIVFCDIMMPGMTGIELYEQLRLRGRSEHEKVVFITGGALTVASREFIRKSQVMCLEKPLTEVTLESAIARCRAASRRVSPIQARA